MFPVSHVLLQDTEQSTKNSCTLWTLCSENFAETSCYHLRVRTGRWSGTRFFTLGTRGCVCSSHSHKSKLGPPGGATNTEPLHGISPSCFQTVGSDEFWLGTRLGDVELDDRGNFESFCRYKGLGDWRFMDVSNWDHYRTEFVDFFLA